MEGYEGFGRSEDYADDELRALRAQEDMLIEARNAEARRNQCEMEKENRRKRIKELGGKPCA